MESISTALLTKCSDPDLPVQANSEMIRSFVKAYKAIGGKLGDSTEEQAFTISAIRRSIVRKSLTPRQLQRGLQGAMENESYITWASVLKHSNDPGRDNNPLRGIYAGSE